MVGRAEFMTALLSDDPRGRFFAELDDLTAGMLGVEGTHHHMQPMSHTADPETGTLWFIGAHGTDLVRSIHPGSTAHFNVVGKNHNFWACAAGSISLSDDKSRLDEVWSPMAAAWFDQGKADPDIALIRLDLRDAEMWTAEAGPLAFGLEIVRANLNAEKKPDIGENVTLTF